MKSYKKWSAEERQRSLALTNRAKRLGLIPPATKCSICGQSEGIIQYHNENYDATLQYVPKLLLGTATDEERKAIAEALVPLCWRCHMVHHSMHRNKEAVERYFAEVRGGKRYPPVYRHDFEILKEHGIT